MLATILGQGQSSRLSGALHGAPRPATGAAIPAGTAEQSAATVEGVGGSLAASTTPDFMTVHATVLSSSAPLAFTLMASAVMHPTFPAKEIERLSQQTLSALPFQLSQPASLAANRVLGGGADSRLFRILREQKSWTYDAHSLPWRPKGVGYFQAGTEVRTSATDSALTELMVQLRRMDSEPVSAEELNAVKSSPGGSLPLTIETAQQGERCSCSTEVEHHVNAGSAGALRSDEG